MNLEGFSSSQDAGPISTGFFLFFFCVIFKNKAMLKVRSVWPRILCMGSIVFALCDANHEFLIDVFSILKVSE